MKNVKCKIENEEAGGTGVWPPALGAVVFFQIVCHQLWVGQSLSKRGWQDGGVKLEKTMMENGEVVRRARAGWSGSSHSFKSWVFNPFPPISTTFHRFTTYFLKNLCGTCVRHMSQALGARPTSWADWWIFGWLDGWMRRFHGSDGTDGAQGIQSMPFTEQFIRRNPPKSDHRIF